MSLHDLEKKFDLSNDLIEDGKYFVSMIKLGGPIDIVKAYNKWPRGSYYICGRRHTFAETMDYVMTNRCFRITRKEYMLLYV